MRGGSVRCVLQRLLGLRSLVWFLFGLSVWAQNPYSDAQRLTRLGQWDSAIRIWQRLLLTEADSVRRALVYQQLAYIALHRRDSAEALALWRQSLKYHPTYQMAWENYLWLRQRFRQPPTTNPQRYTQYVTTPPLSEKAPPTWGERPIDPAPTLRWLPMERLAR